MIFNHKHTVYDDKSFLLETMQDGVPDNLEAPHAASVSESNSISSNSTWTGLGPEYSGQPTLRGCFTGGPDAEALDDINDGDSDEFASLERLERQFAMKHQIGITDIYKGPPHIDSVAILQKAKEEAQIGDESDNEVYENLHHLHHLRRGDPLRENPRAIIAGTPRLIDASRFWAVIIGIDAYETQPLRGCVSDALLMKDYLEEDLKVPRARIQLLLGGYDTPSDYRSEVPSRNNITNRLCSLINNPEIRHGDNIVIFYAGHGSSYACSNHYPKGILGGNSIVSGVRDSAARYPVKTQRFEGIDIFCPTEALCPMDRNTHDSKGHLIPDISDREFNTILHEIAQAKGNHITVIIDSCHSAGITRVPDSIRNAPPLANSPDYMMHVGMENLKYISTRFSIMDKEWKPDMSSHVVLTACKDFQFAEEYQVGGRFHGFFTYSLVCALRSGLWTKELTYFQLVRCLSRGYKQIPDVAGGYMHQRLWYQTT